MNTQTQEIANRQSPIADGIGPKPKAKAKRSAAFSPAGLKKFSMKPFHDWRRLNAAAKEDCELKDLADRLYQVHVELYRIACRRETREAESRDRKLGYPTCWTVFVPDNIFGMKIITRTPNRIIEQRVPTWYDVAAIAFLGDKSGAEKYQPQARPADPNCWLADLDREWHPYDWEKRYAGVGKRVDEVMAQYANRFVRAREEDLREERQRLEMEAS